MDPNKIDSNTNFELIEKAITFRKIVFKSLLIKQYIYFSSANLYSPSYEKIFESDQTIDQPKDTYLILKKETESSLKIILYLFQYVVHQMYGDMIQKTRFFRFITCS